MKQQAKRNIQYKSNKSKFIYSKCWIKYRYAIYVFFNEKRGIYSDEIKYVDDISIAKAVRASCSYPGIFSPYKYENYELIDGGIRENIPWRETKASGADKVFCIKFENKKKTKCRKNIVDVLVGSIDILCHELSNYETDGADFLLTLRTNNISLLDCSKLMNYMSLDIEKEKILTKNINLIK